MAAATPLYPTHALRPDEEQRVLLHGVSWATYVMLRDSNESPSVRMTFLKGSLEIPFGGWVAYSETAQHSPSTHASRQSQ